MEERLEPWLAQGEWLLPLVIAAMLWIAGFVDLFTHRSEPAQVFGLYSIPFAIFILIYMTGFIFWYRMIVDREGVDRLKKMIATVQERAWLGLLLFAGAGGLVASMFLFSERWSRLPLLELSLLLLIVMFVLLVLLGRVTAERKIEPWRRVFIWILGSLAVIEAVLQLMAWFGALPVDNTSGLFIPNGRVYQSTEGMGFGVSNNYGWYYPDFELAEGTTRVVLLGDSYLQGVQIPAEENMGVILNEIINEEASPPAAYEVMSLGMPDYGPSVYLSDILFPVTTDPLEPDEVVILFHLADDFQTLSGPNGPIPYVELDDNGWPYVVEEDTVLLHDLWHVTIRGYESPNLVRIILSHYYTANILRNLFGGPPDIMTEVPPGLSNVATATAEQPFGAAGFMFENPGGERFAQNIEIASKQILLLKAVLDEQGIGLRLVTIPYFPAGFYAAEPGENWDVEMGEYDLLQPERALQTFARENGIAMLPLGAQMAADGLSSSEIKGLFFNEGTGHFTALGHEYVAAAIYRCLFASERDPSCQGE